MELAKNPFFVLGAVAQDNRQRILELEEEKSLSSDEVVAREAAAMLVNPRKRLVAELAWLPGLQPNQVAEALSELMINPKGILNQKDLPLLARANLLADGLKKAATTLSSDDLVQWVIELSRVYDALRVKQIINLLNQERLVSGFPEIAEDNPHIGMELNARRQYFLGAIQNAFDQLNWEDRVQAVTVAVSRVTNEGLDQAPVLIDDLVDKFEVDAQEFLEKESENITALIAEIIQAAKAKMGKADLDGLVAKLEGVVKNWDTVAQPVQVSARSRGLQHAISHKVSGEIRSLAVELTNKYGLIDLSQKLVTLQQEVFAEVDKIVEQSEEDASALNQVAEWKKLQEVLRKAKNPRQKSAARSRRKAVSNKNPNTKQSPRETRMSSKNRRQARVVWFVVGIATIVGLNEFTKHDMLLWAANSGHSNIVQLLVMTGADVHVQNEIGTPLHGATYKSHTEVVSVLLKEKADVNARSYYNEATPLHLTEDPKIVELLLLAGADVHARKPFSIEGGQTPLHSVAFGGSTEVAELLLSAGADIHADSGLGTPLHRAAEGGNVGVAKLLLSLGSGVNESDHSTTPLHYSARGGHTEVVELLLSMGADILRTDFLGFTPLHSAAWGGRSTEVVELLLLAGADIHTKDSHGLTPLNHAVERGHTQIEKILRSMEKEAKRKAEVARRAEAKRKAEVARRAEAKRKAEVARQAEVKQRKEEAMWRVSKCLKITVAGENCRLANTCDVAVEIQYWNGTKSIAPGGVFEVVNLEILAQNREIVIPRQVEEQIVQKRKQRVSNLLVRATERGEIARMRRYIAHDYGHKLDARGAGGTTALMEAVRLGNVEAVRLLIEAGANVNLRADSPVHSPYDFRLSLAGKTVLMMSIPRDFYEVGGVTLYERFQIVEMLINAGADVNAESLRGYTVLDGFSAGSTRICKSYSSERNSKCMEKREEFARLIRNAGGHCSRTNGSHCQ